MLGLVETDRPRICLLPTASGDTEGADRRVSGNRWGSARLPGLGRSRCSGSRAGALRSGRISCAQDIIYVGGGSMINLLADLAGARHRPHPPSGVGSGGRCSAVRAPARCAGSSGASARSTGVARPARGLGVLPGSLSVHYHRDPDRRRAMLAGRLAGASRPATGSTIRRACCSREASSAEVGQRSARGGRVAGRGHRRGRLDRGPSCRLARLCDPRPAIDEPDFQVAELRRTVAARRPGGAWR